MKRYLNPLAALLVLVALFSACSGTDETSGSANSNAQQQATSNSGAQSQIAQNTTPAVAPATKPPAVQPIPPPAVAAEKPAAAGNANAANAASASGADNPAAPKLVVSGKNIDFGKQPQNKTLVRAIVVKNGGRADLKIESVAPS